MSAHMVPLSPTLGDSMIHLHIPYPIVHNPYLHLHTSRPSHLFHRRQAIYPKYVATYVHIHYCLPTATAYMVYDLFPAKISLQASAPTLNSLQAALPLVRLLGHSLSSLLSIHLVMAQAPLFLWLPSTRPLSTFHPILGNKTAPWGLGREGF